MLSKKTTLLSFFVPLLILVGVGLFLGPIPQPQSYHHFADQRRLGSFPHAWNVLSNVGFTLAGLYGLFVLLTPNVACFRDRRESYMWFGVAVGLLLTAVGSAYYHLDPDNARLVWDRLPMTIIFTSLSAALIGERVSIKWGLWFWPLLMAFGIFSVWYWYASELRGEGDLRLYVGVQVFSILVVLAALATESPYTCKSDLAIAGVLFGLGVLFEVGDHVVYAYTGGNISGHTVKHFLDAAAAAWLLRMLSKRALVKEN